MPEVIAVGFQTRLVPGMIPGPEALTPPANFKDKDVIAKWRQDNYEKMQEAALAQPYSATFQSVALCVQADEELKRPVRTYTWSYRDQSNPKSKQPAYMAVWATLHNLFPDAWPNSTHPRYKDGVPPVIFLGFNTRLFIKLMGAECSKPSNWPKDSDGRPIIDQQATLPLSFWYNNSEHRDIEKAVMPEGFKHLTWPMVLKHYNLDEKYRDWKGPHQDADLDLSLIIDLGTYLGILSQD